VLDQRETQLRGLHNAENLMAAMAIGVARGLSFEKMTPALMAYKPQAHRCERIGTLDGVEYINDSKATNLDSLEKALESQSAPVVLIAGGKDKGFGFESITSLAASKARCAILIGEMAGRIEEAWQGSLRCLRAVSLEDAVHLAREESRAGDVVLFSPGTSSFDMFKDYKDRGDQFRTLAINMGVM
jgi:UDP-N-acetylmuramoylalanine--D-glutamate ligase